MKKFTLFLSALLISMVSMAAEVTVSIADYAAANGWENSKQYTSLTMDEVVTVTANPTTGTYNNTGKYYANGNNWRMYQNENPKIVITAAEGHVLTSVTFTYQSEKTGVMVDAAGKQVLSGEAYSLGNVASATFSVSNTTADVTNGQARISSITVSYEAGEGGSTTPEEPETPDTPEEPETPTVPEGAITCAEAVAICEQVGTTGTTEEYTVRGYITEIKYAWSEQYGTATFWIADAKDGENALQAYSCAPLKDADKVFAVGAYVELVGKLKKFNTTNEVEKGTYTIITPAEGGTTPEEPETPEVETVGDGTEANPFTVEDVIALNNTLSGKHYVKAYIVGQANGSSFVDGLDLEAPFEGSTNTDGSIATQGTNLAIASTLTPDTANIIPVQLPKNPLRDDFNLVENPDKLGAQVLICGDLVKYFNLPGIKNTTSIVVLGDTPETPDTPEEPEVPEVTADTITCAEAATIAAAENYLGTDTVTVVGYVTELGNAKEDGSKQCFYMADTKDGGKVFMAYWAFVSKLYVVGDKVAVTGILKNYNGTIEIVDGQSALLEAAAGETPETPDTPEEPEVPEVTIDTITCAEAATIAAAENYLGTDTVTVVGYVTELGNAKEDGSKQCFYMADTKDGGKVFMAYWAFVSKLYVVGDKVAVTGILKNYNGTIEIVDGQSELLEAAAGETPDDGGETPDDGGETPEDGKVTFAAASDKGNSTSDPNNAAEYTITKNGVTMVVSQGVVTDHYRIYKNQTLTISAAGKTITSIEITCTMAGEEKYGPGCFVTETPSYTYSEKIGTWTGEATEVTFTASLNQVRATQIVVTVAETSEDYVATPTISGEADFMEKTTVTITAEEGLEVYYTLDGTDPTKASTKYAAPFELTATTTVKAIAYNGDKASAVVEKKFTKMTILTCAEAVALCTNPATPGQHIIHGYITEMIEAYNDQYKNITFWMADTPDGGQVLQAFRVKPVSDVEQSLKVGDFVEVIGSLILYTKDGVSTPEVNAGGSVKLITAGDTAVDNLTVDQQTSKFIQNGQLVILKDGIRYNALGQVIK